MADGGDHGGSAGRSPARGRLVGSRFLAAFENAEERQALEAVARSHRILPANVDLMREGDTTDQLYVLVEGWACRYKTTREGGRQIVALLVPGDVANLDALMFARPDFGVRTLTPITFVPLPCDDVRALASHHTGIARVLTRLAMIENAVLSQWALCLGRMSAQQRVAHLLCELGERLCPQDSRDGMSFDLPLTQEHIADTTGLTTVHVNRTLQRLREESLVHLSNRRASFPHVARLRSLAGFDGVYLHASGADDLRPRSCTG